MSLFLSRFVATFLFSGLVKKAPGTVSSFLACVIAFFLLRSYNTVFLVMTIASGVLGYFATMGYIFYTKKEDPGEVTIDEVFVIWLLIFLCNMCFSYIHEFWICLVCFVTFRFFDIIKPFPINVIDKQMEGASGVMLDDVVAGIFAFGISFELLTYISYIPLR